MAIWLSGAKFLIGTVEWCDDNDDNNDDDYNDDNLIQLSQKGDVLSFIKCQQKSVFSFCI